MVKRHPFSLSFLYASLVVILLSANSSSASNIDKIPDSILLMTSGFVVTVDKKNQKLYVFKRNYSSFSKVYETTCSTGKNQGGKQVSGDAKTPNGIFFATKILNNPGPPETYGTLAFPLDYPTVMDKKAGRNGRNIWIHGTTKPLIPFQSNGCVVLIDKDIHQLSKYIALNKTPIIIDETINWVPQNQVFQVKNELENLLAAWNRAYFEGNMKGIDALYLEGHQIKDKKREQLLNRLSSIKNLNQHFFLEPRDVAILHQNNNAVIVFDQITEINKDSSFEGSFFKLNLQKVNNKWFIIDEPGAGDSVSSISKANVSLDRQPPLTHETETLSSKDAVRKVVSKWAESWKSGNMTAYKACYASNFHNQGMNLNDWVSHKINVREKSGNISIRISNLNITVKNNLAIATFTQHYSSKILKSNAAKRLELRKMNGEWKIYRETML
jgi:murein L,D-transpeptidase YafK